MSYILILSTIVKALPQLIAVMVAVENAVKESGHGSAKLEAVLEIVRLTLTTASNLNAAQIQQTVELIAKLIPVVVNLFNKAGWPALNSAESSDPTSK